MSVNIITNDINALRASTMTVRSPQPAVHEYVCQTLQTPPEANTRPVARSLNDFVRPLANDPDELIKHRFLCKGGGLLLVGPTGHGKSSLSMQLMIKWALGQSVFGLEPARPLKSLLIQAENDDGDLGEMREGVFNG